MRILSEKLKVNSEKWLNLMHICKSKSLTSRIATTDFVANGFNHWFSMRILSEKLKVNSEKWLNIVRIFQSKSLTSRIATTDFVANGFNRWF